MEFFTKDGPPVTYTAEVVWIEALKTQDGTAPPARFDVGLKFLYLEPSALKALLRVLGPLEAEGDENTSETPEPLGERK